MSTILLIDDDPHVRSGFTRALRQAGHEVHASDSGAQALQLLQDTPIDLVLSDVLMEGMSGLELLRRVRAIAPELPVVLLTGRPSEDERDAAHALGAQALLAKPIRIAELLEAIARAISQRGPPG